LLRQYNTDILKIVVVNRYEDRAPAIAFIKMWACNKAQLHLRLPMIPANIVAVVQMMKAC
jgi:adenine deaminase